jgi:hypothetical protein
LKKKRIPHYRAPCHVLFYLFFLFSNSNFYKKGNIGLVVLEEDFFMDH